MGNKPRAAMAVMVTALLMASAAQARVAPPSSVPPPVSVPSARSAANPSSTSCPLTFSFASYGAGIDRTALTRIDAMLAHDRRVTRVDRQQQGREGETTLCVHTRRASDVRRIAQAARRLVPASPRGPVQAASPTRQYWQVNQRGWNE